MIEGRVEWSGQRQKKYTLAHGCRESDMAKENSISLMDQCTVELSSRIGSKAKERRIISHRLTMPNGLVYCGAFLDGQQHGPGEVTIPPKPSQGGSEEPVKLKGVWKHGEMQ